MFTVSLWDLRVGALLFEARGLLLVEFVLRGWSEDMLSFNRVMIRKRADYSSLNSFFEAGVKTCFQIAKADHLFDPSFFVSVQANLVDGGRLKRVLDSGPLYDFCLQLIDWRGVKQNID
jgi:hypothetical protein